jgi:hypothetical protein
VRWLVIESLNRRLFQQHLSTLFEDVSLNYGDGFWVTLYVELRSTGRVKRGNGS